MSAIIAHRWCAHGRPGSRAGKAVLAADLYAKPQPDGASLALSQTEAGLSPLLGSVDGIAATAGSLLTQTEAHFHTDVGPSIFLRKEFCEAA